MKKAFCALLALTLLIHPISVAAAEEDESYTHILLVGRDNRDEEPARSDCMILCSVSPESKTILFTSFLRDLYVPIPGYRSNRLNAAYAFGGAELLKKTLEENFRMEIDGCIEVDFSSFPKIIDALGGVSLELRQDEADAINAEIEGNLTEGTHLLTGDQALAYSRIRKLDEDGDFSRSLRQRKLLTSLLERYRSADLLTLLSAVADTIPLLSSDLSSRQLLKLCIRLFPMLEEPNITSRRIPADGTYVYDTVRGMSVLLTDPEELQQQFHQFFEAKAENDF